MGSHAVARSVSRAAGLKRSFPTCSILDPGRYVKKIGFEGAPAGMNPRLTSIAGPLKGTSYPLAVEETTIGRESSNQLCIGDSSVSRRHCLVKREGDLFRVKDLESLNGTFINDVPVKE